ncbi:uncharacterized protein LOC111046916 [Nilaparvata lugens]|uniref:uncharacterized protein LOC111046916 n=1 Tax=Nilaparvata lugens TaxID=108931 RepID=UPI00193D3B57|nr:uncharacterized protein LOC111046916 [Nilaparvata lugens]
MCRYDASHYIKPEEMGAHLLVCEKRELCQDSFEITHRPRSRPCNSAYITDDSENWDDDDDDCMDEERTTISKKNARSVKASTEAMALYHENAYGFVTTIGRGTFRSHLGALPSASSCLALSTSKTQRPDVEEKKYEEVIKEKEKEEEMYDDFDDNYNESSLDMQSFKKFYKDIHLPSRKSPEPETHSAEEITRANIKTANRSFGRGNMRHLLDSFTTTKEPPASRGIGRGRGCLSLVPEFLESAEKKPIARVDMQKEMATVEDMLEAVKFQPSKAKLQGLFDKQHGDDWESD